MSLSTRATCFNYCLFLFFYMFGPYSDHIRTYSDIFGHIRTMFGHIRIYSNHIRTYSDRIWTISGPYSDLIRAYSDTFGYKVRPWPRVHLKSSPDPRGAQEAEFAEGPWPRLRTALGTASMGQTQSLNSLDFFPPEGKHKIEKICFC